MKQNHTTLGGRDLVPRVPGRWRFLVLAGRSSSAAWSAALTARSSGRVRVTPFRRRALKPWARLPITVAAASRRVTFSFGARQCWSPHALLLADPDTQKIGRPLPSQLLTAHHPSTKPNLRPVMADKSPRT